MSGPVYRLPPLTDGTIIRRYKRFLADVRLADGRMVTAHCANTGSMTGCWKPAAPVQLSHSDNPRRKLPWTLERVDMGRGWIGVNTARVNDIIAAAIAGGHIPALEGYARIQREPAFNLRGYPPSRLDVRLSGAGVPDAYVEVKNTTLVDGPAIRFPDAITERGRKHLELLRHAVRRGHRAVIVFALNRPEGEYFEPAWDIDPDYGHTLERAVRGGVEVLAVRLNHVTGGVAIAGSVLYRGKVPKRGPDPAAGG